MSAVDIQSSLAYGDWQRSHFNECFIGYVCEEYNNPPDFFLDIISGYSTVKQHDEGIINLHASAPKCEIIFFFVDFNVY